MKSTLKARKSTARSLKSWIKKLSVNARWFSRTQWLPLNERAKVDYIVSEGLINHHLYKDEKDREDKVQKVLREVGLLPEFASRFPHRFSGGSETAAFGIYCRALVMEPEFIVADEPISALDVSIRAQVLNLLNRLKRDRGLTLSLHRSWPVCSTLYFWPYRCNS